MGGVRSLIGNALVDPDSTGEVVVEGDYNRRGRAAQRQRVPHSARRRVQVNGALLLMDAKG